MVLTKIFNFFINIFFIQAKILRFLVFQEFTVTLNFVWTSSMTL